MVDRAGTQKIMDAATPPPIGGSKDHARSRLQRVCMA
jgi:hypothetical protein